MRFGWLTLAHSPSPDDDYTAIRDLVTQACFAETAGFDGIWLTEHNFTGESVYCDPIPFASVLAARTSRIRIGFAVIQLALRHPIRLATELALLDNLSDGRIDVGVGHGTNYNEYEFVGYGLRSDESRERMEETLDVMLRAWTGAPLVHHGKFYQLSLPELRPRPRQRPHPPIWRAASSAGSVRKVEPSRTNPWNDPLVPHEDGVRYSLKTGALCGTAQRVAEQVAELREAGVHHVLCQMTCGHLPHAKIMASMRRFGEDVAPRFR
jgi:alkanesulfonate monooxygenase SsuD/methylene tetrahydromethanopterin reductase-like flavin-dependent oxidoreductase (luciferase family)